MTHGLTTAGPVQPLRENNLVSVCLGELPNTPAAFEELRQFAARMAAVYRFWEIIVVSLSDEVDPLLRLVRDIPNIRLIKVRSGTEYYRRRAIAVDEAIGDVVVLTSVHEISALDILTMIERAHADEVIVAGKLIVAPALDRLLAGPWVAFGHWAGFQVGVRDMQTVVFPRTLLNQILAHPAKELALRFLPRDTGIPQVSFPAHGPVRAVRASRDFARRLTLAQMLLINLAPRLLQSVTLISMMVALLSLFFAVYVVLIWLLKSDVAPGWLTLSGMLSATGFMLGCVSSGLCLGMQYLLNRADQSRFDDVSAEVNRVDLFGSVARDLNVETDVGADVDASVPRDANTLG